MPTIRLAEGRAYAYEERGTGIPLLLLHGFPFSSQSFRPQLDSPPKGLRVIAPDHRGFGGSTLTGEVSSMSAMAADALALLDSLNVESAVVGGVSMGGYVALALARLDPGRVRGLVLVDTQATADDEAGRARREAVAVDVTQNGVAGLVAGMLPKLLAVGTNDGVRQRIESMMLKQDARGVAAASRGMGARVDSKDLLARFSGPTLVIVGEHDAITPPAKAKEMADLVNGAQLEIVPDSGHLTNLEQPAAFKRLLEQFATKF
jgi:pimeloyl-ACP methyl ester carboxylesterase